MKKIILTLLFIFSCFLILPLAQSECLKADGLSFKVISSFKFLASRDNKNIAILTVFVDGGLKKNEVYTFQFFVDKICDLGAAQEFLLNDVLHVVSEIRRF